MSGRLLGLLDVFPAAAPFDGRDGRLVHPVLFGECFLEHSRRKGGADTSDGPIGQLCVAVSASPWGPLPSLRHHVCAVVSVGPKKEMIGTNTKRSVAVVANAHSARNWPVRQHPCDSMRANALLFGWIETPIAGRKPASGPKPTGVGSSGTIHATPETRVKIPSSHWAPPMPVVRDRFGVRAPSGPVHFAGNPQGNQGEVPCAA